MNKDLDERLVPQGEYRDAMNIQVTTSEGSNVGTIQNILGNANIGLPFQLSANAKCIGSVVDEKNDAFYWLVHEEGDGVITSKDIIFEHKNNTVTAVFVDNKGPNNCVLCFTNNMVSGINIIDDLLFWTDNATEPKKINIPLSITGTSQTGNQHTRLINPAAGITFASNIDITEEHITVIRKAPLVAPCLKMVGERPGNSYGYFSYDFNGVFVDAPVQLTIVGVNSPSLNYEVGDILLIKENDGTSGIYPVTNSVIRVVINVINGTTYSCSIIGIKPNLPVGLLPYAVDLDKSYEKLYQLKFPRFAFRWKYKDNEYSSFGPFSEPAFIPGAWDEDPLKISYLPNSGYNLGMQNRLRELTILGLVPIDIPLDVKQVDILYKESNSPNVYVVDEIRPADAYWTSNSYLIQQDVIKSILPSNQLLRPWDNVPKKALAQELVGNRIVYANYEQNYNLDPSNQFPFNSYRADFDVSLKNRSSAGLKSIKSIRNYQFGVVYTDIYNRQTPVLTDLSGSLAVSKLDAAKTTRVEIKSNTTPPTWATHQKFYVKETSTEYYNLSLDRYFDAEDGNIWLSFASNDRDKIDLDTTLYLKKRYNSTEPETSTVEYKVIDVKNEAPEYIKTRRVLLGSADNEGAQVGNAIFTGGTAASGNLPVVGEKEFHIEAGPLNNTLLENFHKKHNSPDSANTNTPGGGGGPSVENPLFIKIKGVDALNNTLQETNYYEVDNVVRTDASDSKYIIKIKNAFQTDASFTNINDITVASDMSLSTNAGAMKLVLDVSQDIVQNKSVFQGRFFVKILMDSYIQDAIVSQGQFQNVQVLKTANFGYIKDFQKEDPACANYTLADHSTAISNFNSAGFGTNVSWDGPPTTAFPIDAYWSHAVWQRIQEKLDNLPTTSRWVIDEAFAVGEEPIWTHGGDQAVQKYGGTPSNAESDLGSTNYAGYTADPDNTNQSSLMHNEHTLWTTFNGNPNSYPVYSGGLNHGSNIANYEYYTEGKGVQNNTIDLSYIGPGRNMNGGGTAVFSTVSDAFMQTSYDPSFWPGMFPPLYIDPDVRVQYPSRWVNKWSFTAPLTASNLGEIGDAADELAKEFALELIPGNYLRFKKDPNSIVYEITDVKIYYKLNYAEDDYSRRYPLCDTSQGLNPTPNNWLLLDSPSRYWQNHPHFNQRITYRLTLEAPSPGDPIGTDGAGNIGYIPTQDPNTQIEIPIADATDNCPIEIVTVNYIQDTNDIPFPENPAVFETEPKDNVDLDIFHEVSDTLPLQLVGNAGHAFAPIGTAITTPEPSDAPLGGGQVGGSLFTYIFNTGNNAVVGWNGDIVELKRPVNASTMTVEQQAGATFIFTRCDGSYTTATYVGMQPPFLPMLGFTSYFMKVVPNVSNNTVGLGWHNCYAFGNGVESNRIRDTFNSVFIDKGPKVSTTLEEGYEQERRKYGLIYSGLYNSISGVNNLNQFIQAEKITKEVNPTYGSIQKLHTRDSDLVTLCEDKVLRILANKDAVFNADGNPQLTATNRVLGQTVPFSGEFGISTNPESFASEAYRAYFTDKVRGKVMRLSRDGLTPISDYGMKDWFKDNLKLANLLIGSYDDKRDEYNITIDGIDQITQTGGSTLTVTDNSTTVTFREDVKGWVSFKSFLPEEALSCASEYYTFLDGQLWLHYVENFASLNNRNNFYGDFTNSSFTPILNHSPGIVKSFNTLNYEGTRSRVVPVLDAAGNTIDDGEYYNLAAKTGWYVDLIFTNKESGRVDEFIEKEGKWFNYIKGDPALHGPDGDEWDNTTDANIMIDADGFSSWDQASFAVQGLGMYAVYGCTDPTATNFIGGSNNTGSCSNATFLPSVTNQVALDNSGALSWFSQNAPNAVWMDYYFENATFPPVPGQCAGASGNATTQLWKVRLTYTSAAGVITPSPDFYDYNTMVGWANANGCPAIHAGMLTIPPSSGLPDYLYSELANCSMTFVPLGYPCTGCNPPINITGVIDDGSCTYPGYGCMDPLAHNYDSTATVDDGSCDYTFGCMDTNSINHNPNATVNSGCEYLGCLDPVATNYGMFDVNDSLTYSWVDSVGLIYTQSITDITQDCGSSCCEIDVLGCTDLLATNYNSLATVDDGSCDYSGCTDPLANNYNANALTDDGSCLYDPTWNCINGACVDPGNQSGAFSSLNDCLSSLRNDCDVNAVTGYPVIPGVLSGPGIHTSINDSGIVDSFPMSPTFTNWMMANHPNTPIGQYYYECTSLSCMNYINNILPPNNCYYEAPNGGMYYRKDDYVLNFIQNGVPGPPHPNQLFDTYNEAISWFNNNGCPSVNNTMNSTVLTAELLSCYGTTVVGSSNPAPIARWNMSGSSTPCACHCNTGYTINGQPNNMPGCTDPTQIAFWTFASIDDGTSCGTISQANFILANVAGTVGGCTDNVTPALNYDPNATVNDGTCQY